MRSPAAFPAAASRKFAGQHLPAEPASCWLRWPTPLAAEKFARFLLEQVAEGEKVEGEVRATLTLTHEEIAQMIGSSRETVTRLFSDFKKRQVLQVKGSTVVIRDLAALSKLAGG